jgi:hypothetical protein
MCPRAPGITVSARARSLIGAEPYWFQNRTAWIIGSASTSVAGWEMAR